MDAPSRTQENIPRVARVVLWGVWASLIVGQLVRFPLPGQGGGILVSDIATLVALFTMLCLASVGRMKFTGRKILLACFAGVPFLLWGFIVLIAQSGSLGFGEVAVALSYWVRLACIFALFSVLAALRSEKKRMLEPLSYVYITLLALGYLQRIFFPNLSGAEGGWDPHSARMFGTWLDPNFFGAFLAMFLPFGAQRMHGKAGIFLAVLAILLTQSRSVYIAVCVASILCGALWLSVSSVASIPKRRLVFGGLSIFVLALLGFFLLGDRATKLFVDDPTALLRADAYRATWRYLAEDHIMFGTGYNAYQFAAKQAGLVSDFTIHSRAGSDSSILTLLVTTGVIGTGLCMAPIVFGLFWHAQKWLFVRKISSLWFIWATIVLLVHSQFTNSLLYPHILVPYLMMAALIL